MFPAKLPGKLPVDNPNLGRIRIYTDETEVTSENVMEILSRAMPTHMANHNRILYLWDYYRGRQPILDKVKEVRPEINNKIVENRAQEIISFKTAYLISEPMQYIANGDRENLIDDIDQLNGYMRIIGKAGLDKEMVDWMYIAGVGYRLVLSNTEDDDEVPFVIHIPEPWHTFVVYSSQLGNKPMLGVQYIIKEDGTIRWSCWSKDTLYEIEGDHVLSATPHTYGMIPLIEYPCNTARLGAFEIVLDLLDAINAVSSDRMDGVDQFIQSLMKFINCDVDEKTFTAMKQLGAIKIKSRDGNKADVEIMTSELDQSQTQMYKDDLYNAILTICGMPNRNGSGSTSDTGAAVSMRDGWSNAEARAKDTELCLKRSEEQFLKLILKICKDRVNLQMKVSEIEMKFTRYNFADILSKSQVLTTMLASPKIHPELAFRVSGLFTDPEAAYIKSDQYYTEQLERFEQQEQDVTLNKDGGGYDANEGGNGWVNKRQAKRPMGNSGSAVKGAASGNQS